MKTDLLSLCCYGNVETKIFMAGYETLNNISSLYHKEELFVH